MLVLRAVDVCQVGLARTPNIRCIYSTFGREITKCTVIYGVYVVFLAGNHQVYGHIRCIYGNSGREITQYTVIYGVYVVILAGKSQNIRSYTVHIYGPGQP